MGLAGLPVQMETFTRGNGSMAGVMARDMLSLTGTSLLTGISPNQSAMMASGKMTGHSGQSLPV